MRRHLRDDSDVKSTDALEKDPGSSQHRQGGSQPSVTPVSGYVMPSSDLHQHKAQYTCRQNTHTDRVNKSLIPYITKKMP